MNWQTEIVSRLKDYDAARSAATTLQGEVERLQAMINSPGTARTDIPVKSGKNREDWLIGQMLLLDETVLRLELTRRWLESMDRAFSMLNPEEKLVLHRLYICPQKSSLDRLCAELGAERSTVYRKRDAALRHLTTALCGPM